MKSYDTLVHPTLKVLDVPLTSGEDFETDAECMTPLGRVYFSRMKAPGQKAESYGYWIWGIETAHRSDTDFDTLDDDNKYVGLELAVQRANWSLKGLMKNIESSHALFLRGRTVADHVTLMMIPEKYRVAPTTNEASSMAIAVGASIKAMLDAIEKITGKVRAKVLRDAAEAWGAGSSPQVRTWLNALADAAEHEG